jgi:uncharacterized tellurite resistance protein B-like protein
MNYNVIGSYPTELDKNQLKSYVSVLLNIADVDGISKSEMNLIEQLAKQANVDPELLEACLGTYKTFDLTNLPDYKKQWAYCILRDAILIADCDNGISSSEKSYLQKIAEFAGIESDFEKVINLTLSQKQNAETWESLLSE